MDRWLQMIQQGGQGAAYGASMGGGYGAIIGGVAGLGLGAISPTSEESQLAQQGRLNQLNMRYNIGMMNAQKASQLDMWNKTNYEAQKKHMENAGLNPGLMYGMSGGGGSTTGSASGGNFQSQAGSDVAREQNAIMRTSQQMQLGLMEAQKANIEADTKLKGVTADKTSGVDTELERTKIDNLIAQTENTKVDTEGKQLKNLMSDIELTVARGTSDLKVQEFEYKVEQARLLINKINIELPYVGEQLQANLDNTIAGTKAKEQDVKTGKAQERNLNASASNQEFLNTEDQRDLRTAELGAQVSSAQTKAGVDKMLYDNFKDFGIPPNGNIASIITGIVAKVSREGGKITDAMVKELIKEIKNLYDLIPK